MSNDPPAEESGSGIAQKESNVPDAFLLFRKVGRWIAGLWFLVALVLMVSGVVALLREGPEPGSLDFVFWVIVIAGAASLFWFVPDRFIKGYQRSIEDALNDPGREIHITGADSDAGSFRRVEIVPKEPAGVEGPVLQEDPLGRVVFDSTQRPLRLLFGGAFLLVGLLIGLFIYLFSDTVGFFEVFFVCGWSVFCLAGMGLVYEVTLTRHRGIVDRKAGWFFIVRRQHYLLREFDRVIVTSTFRRSRYDSTLNRYRAQDPRFKVDLAGNSRLNLRVFPRVSDARRMAGQLCEYLELPLEEKSEALH